MVLTTLVSEAMSNIVSACVSGASGKTNVTVGIRSPALIFRSDQTAAAVAFLFVMNSFTYIKALVNIVLTSSAVYSAWSWDFL